MTSTRRRTTVAGIAGTIGVLGLAASARTLLELAPPPPEIASLPFGVQVLLVLGNPLVFVWVAAVAGARFAPRTGLRFHAADAAVEGYRFLAAALAHAVRRDWALALATGATLGAATAIADRFVLTPLLTDAWRNAITGAASPELPHAVTALLYGGIAEEVMLRWGVMSACAVLFGRLSWNATAGETSRESAVRPGIIWMAIIVAAGLFAAGHLPAASAIGLDVVATLRVVLLNGAGGLLFGWLYWKRGLEAAMLAHMAAHAGMWTIASLTH